MAERNCNTCKRSMFERCETLKNNEAYQNIKEDSFFGVEKHEFKSHFICDDYLHLIKLRSRLDKLARERGIDDLRVRRMDRKVQELAVRVQRGMGG